HEGQRCQRNAPPGGCRAPQRVRVPVGLGQGLSPIAGSKARRSRRAFCCLWPLLTADAPTLRSFSAKSFKYRESRPSGDAAGHFPRLFNGLRECRKSAIGTAVEPVARAILGKAGKFRQSAGLARKMSAIGFDI